MEKERIEKYEEDRKVEEIEMVNTNKSVRVLLKKLVDINTTQGIKVKDHERGKVEKESVENEKKTD